MLNWLRAVLPASVWRLARGIATALYAPIAFSIRTGHWRTALTGKIVDRNGEPMPWYTYPMLDFLADKDFTGARVLEFGGGHSTLWWAKRGASVFVIEPDEAWADWIRERTFGLPVGVTHVPCDNVSRDMCGVEAVLSGLGQFDIIAIDGHLRQECALASAAHLRPGGSMIIDNFETMDFAAILARPGCRKVAFNGMVADGHIPTTTALLFWGDCKLLEAVSEPRLRRVA